jgi:hypothetical protein
MIVPLKGPKSTELSSRFDEAREWAASLIGGSSSVRGRGYRVETRRVNHRVLGRNDIPDRIWVDSLDDALFLTGHGRDAAIFEKMITTTAESSPPLLAYLTRYPMQALEFAGDWDRLLDVALWVARNPNSGLYLRQIDLPGVHTKFIEANKAILARLLDALLPPEAINRGRSPSSGFALRYGLKSAPEMIRFRPPLNCADFPPFISDMSIPADEFARLDLKPCPPTVLVVENLVNYLSIPQSDGLLTIWGSGYGFDSLRSAGWLNGSRIFYWGDIDTHGFAILNQFRALFPSARSVLMDRETLMGCRDLWVEELRQSAAELPNLTEDEQSLYRDLRENALGERVRLEQERIGFRMVESVLEILRGDGL